MTQHNDTAATNPVETLLRLRDEPAATCQELRSGDSTELLRDEREERAASFECEGAERGNASSPFPSRERGLGG